MTFKCFLAYKLKSSNFSRHLKVTNQSKTEVICKHSSTPIQPTNGSTGTSTQGSCCHHEGSCMQQEGSKKALPPPHCSMCWHSPPVLCARGTGALPTLASADLSAWTGRAIPPLVPQMDHPLEVGTQPWFSITWRGCRLCAQNYFVTHIKAHWVPWEMCHKTTHQTEELTRMCAEKGLE